jgi:hypothetical protein
MHSNKICLIFIYLIFAPLTSLASQTLDELLTQYTQAALDGSVIDLEDVVLKKDVLEIRLVRGTFSFCRPVEGITPGGLFRGEARVTFSPVRERDRASLRRLYEKDSIQETVQEIFFLFSDGTEQRLISEGRKAASVKKASAKDFSGRFREWLELLHPNFEFMFIQKVLARDGAHDFFLAEFKTKKKGDLSFLFDEGKALEVMLFHHTKRGPFRVAEIWCQSNREAEEKNAAYLASRYKKEKDLIETRHYQMDLRIPDRKKLHLEGEMTFVALKDHVSSVALNLLNNISDFNVVRNWDEKERQVRLLSLTDSQGRALPWLHRKHQLLVRFPEPLIKGETAVLRFQLEAEIVIQMSKNAFWFPNTSPWFPAYGYHGGRAVFEWTAGVQKPYRAVISGTTVRAWEEDDKNASELISSRPIFYPGVVFGEYEGIDYREEGVGPLLKVYSLKETLGRKQREPIGERCCNVLRFFTKRLGPYPFEELKVAPVALEHGAGRALPGLVQLTGGAFSRSGGLTRETRLLDSLIAHEIAHQWWGHTVTYESDEDLWLCESFAEYMAGMYLEAEKPAGEFEYKLKTWRQKAMNADKMVPLDQLTRMEYKYFRAGKADELLYGRGPYLVHMLRTLVGEEAFLNILRRFCAEYAGEDVNISLFQQTVARVAGENYDWFFQQWVRGAGVPDVHLEDMAVTVGEGGFLHRLRLRQSCEEGLKGMPLPVMFRFSDGDEAAERMILSGAETETFDFIFPRKAKKIILDPEKEILCKIRQ